MNQVYCISSFPLFCFTKTHLSVLVFTGAKTTTDSSHRVLLTLYTNTKCHPLLSYLLYGKKYCICPIFFNIKYLCCLKNKYDISPS